MPTPELEPQAPPEQNENVTTHPEALSLPEKLEQDTGIKSPPVHPQTLTDDQTGQHLAQSIPDDTNTVNVTLPTDKNTLDSWAKGNANDSKTWLAVFLNRTISKALFIGKKIKLIISK